MILYFVTLLLLLILPMCSPYRINTHKEKQQLNQYSNKMLEIDTDIQQKICKGIICDTEFEKNRVLSIDQAVASAIAYNNTLQAELESLGIAKADLVQAGLLRNPRIESSYKIPRSRKTGEYTKIELDLSFSISDIWQIPRKKRVASDELELASLRVMNLILDIYTKTKFAYYQCIYAQSNIKLAQSLYKESKKFYKRTIYRTNFGYSSELDINTARIMLQHWKIEVVRAQGELFSAFRELEKVLGTTPTNKPLNLTTQWNHGAPDIPSIESAEQYALENRPEMQIARARIKRACDSLDYEHAKFLPSVELGLSYEREIDNKKLVGPLLNIEFPLFDSNYAQVARARYQIEREKRLYNYEQKTTLIELKQLYNKFMIEERSLELYKKMLPSLKESIRYTGIYVKTMQINMLTLFQTRISYYEHVQAFLKSKLELLRLNTFIEKTIGKKIKLNSDF